MNQISNAPDPAGPAGELTALPNPLAGGEGLAAPSQRPHTPLSAFQTSGFPKLRPLPVRDKI